ncbi:MULTISPECIES: hypothetical protein [Kyrpidia]|uniref:Uncharacterized protein n=2 Tax=Kyrpidia spormannii TaxID=2055160 RepID=A0A6F9DYJ1_9BACL|nr:MULTISPECIES: hypothetical protein [Kyrpidia]MCL6577523.1 DUF2621 domain-containing protein [Kyrpidia sp.]CAB3389188.1 conserved protein of unknown function [Kyrpidia spormannii]CAB3389634.1 conserved protein of unknown function [Kyrpidia spormannii]HHY66585.1 hypothetical protein [Alicyclobacillus sp.]
MQEAVVWSVLGIGLSAVLLLVILAGGFFMFRAFLRKMAPDQNRPRDD